MKLAEFIKEGVAALEQLYPTAEARSIVFILCEDKLGTKNYTHIIEPEYEVPSAKEPALREALGRLCNGEPIQYVTGKAEFCGFTFKVSPNVLIPRPETELLCREAIKVCGRMHRMREAYGDQIGPVRVLDLCTGSGCIAWTVLLSVPRVEVTAVDISEEALKVAESQSFAAELKACGNKAPTFIQADVLDTDHIPALGKFDVILSNPPYILESEKPKMRRNVLDYEPSLALFVPDEDPLKFHEAIMKWSETLISHDGVGFTEINESLAPETQALIRSHGFTTADIIKDFFDKNRFIAYKK